MSGPRPGDEPGVSPRLLAVAAVSLAALLGGCSADEEAGPTTGAAPVEPAAPQPQEEETDEAEALTIPEIVRRLEPSIVTLRVGTARGEGGGSGVIWAADGTIVTNNHVVEDAEALEVVFASGQRLDGEVQATDPLTDLAVVRVDRDDLPAATFAEDLPQVGELAVAMGSPLGFEETVTAGIISGLHRSIPSGGQTPALVDLLQTDAPISPGNSGGALVGAEGTVLGINTAYIPPEARAVSIGFAIPAPTVASVVTQLIETGRVEHAYLGVRPAELTQELAERFDLDVEAGAIVLQVLADTPAERAGIREGDVIVALDDREITSVEDLYAALREFRPESRVAVRLVREGEERTVEVTLAARTADDG